MKTGLNMHSVKAENRSLILYLLQKNGSMSRKEIAEKLGLTPAAVTKICNDLIFSGVLKETGEISKGCKGRKEILLSLNFGKKFVLGINAGTTHITYSLSKLSGEVVSVVTSPFTDDIDAVLKNAKELLNNNNVNNEDIFSVGLCVVGSATGKGYGIWDCKALYNKTAEKFGVPVTIENNVRAFAQSEMLYSGDYSNEAVLFFKWGPGIGSAIALDGKILSGNDKGVAEIGHYIVNPAGKKCRCGRYGCLETEAGEEALVTLTKLQLEEIITSQNEDVINILDEKIDTVALALTNTATILNAKKIVLFGSVFSNETVVKKLKKQCIRYNENLTDDMIIISKQNEKIGYIGPVAICAKKFFFELQEQKPNNKTELNGISSINY